MTHLGPDLDQAVLRAKRRMRIGVDPDYDLVQRRFDVMHYMLQSPAVLDRPRVDLVEDFFRNGVRLKRSPDPHFSMSAYLARYPGKANGEERSPYLEWVKRGRRAGEIADPAPGIEDMAHVLGLRSEEALELLVERRTDLLERFRTGRLGEMMAKAAEVEPLIGATWTELAKAKLLPFTTPLVTGQVSAIYRAQEAVDFSRARVVLVINRPRWGGGRRLEGHIAHALATDIEPADILVVYTDDVGTAPDGRYPTGTRTVDFGALVQELQPEQAQSALVAFLRSLHADAVVNINSRMLYHALRTYGPAMAGSERLFLCFFCNEKSAMGHWQGWSLGYFYRMFGHVAGVIVDSENLSDQLVKAYHLPASQRERLHVFRAPVDSRVPLVPERSAEPGRRPQVFWAGRWDRQKRTELFLDVARRMPDVDFRMWGEAVMGRSATDRLPPNLTVEGLYGHISEIPLAEADAWLYTSGWDGVPSILLEVAVSGIPIVGTLVGGTGEVLGDEAWPISATAGAEEYEKALRDVLADPAVARSRALALRERMLAARTEKAFASQVLDALLMSDPRNEEQP